MQPLRYNGFSMIHKALRSMLYDAALSLQHTDFTNIERTRTAFGKVERILELFDDHADHEDHHILTAVKGVNPALAEDFEQEHVLDRALCAELRSAISGYEAAAAPADMIHAGNKVFYAFNEFIAFNLRHMNKEETVLNKALWDIYTDEGIAEVNQRIAASVPPDKAVENLSWMMRSCNDTEIAMFLKGIRLNAPDHLANMVFQVAEKEIPAYRWDLIKARLDEQVPAQAVAITALP